MTSPFLEAPVSAWVAENALAFALEDRFPVSPGHTLVIPRRLFATWFEATPEERTALFELVDEVKRVLDERLHPDGYNIGINAGEAAGQTVPHLHVHVIPRYRGDVDDPRGGVRHVIPGKGNYLASGPRRLATGGEADPFFDHLAPLFQEADEVAILAAFVRESGLDQLEKVVFQAIRRGGRVRLITGDYLSITQPEALFDLLDWAGAPSGVAPADGDGDPVGDDESEAEAEIDRPADMVSQAGSFEARVVETAMLGPRSRSFHPKSWRFEGPAFGAAFVGSSNVSRSALGAGIEWNLRVDRLRDPVAYQAICAAFEHWWARARPLTPDWVRAYALRAKAASRAEPPDSAGLPPGEEEPTPIAPPPPPHEIQRQALVELARCREDLGWGRALVVLATGLGKTYLAALDIAEWAKSHGRLPRVLVLAHREELLFQAAKTLRRLLWERAPRFGWFSGSRADLEGDVVFASVQKLSRPEHLARLSRDRFDYVVVDEVHHGTALSYRSILDRIDPGFLLGLTATPERADGADVLGLFDDHVAYRADLGTGIQRKLLVPFSYHGLRDDTDFQKVPFRNRRFDPAELGRAVDNEPRFLKMLAAWQEHPGSRTLVFCCTIAHAEHARDFLLSKGVRAEAVHSGRASAPREQSLADLVAGKLEALCTVDLFNEGVDLPDVDRVVMLRPTESPVVFLQQLGRGLRISEGKRRLTVLDFVGNHRVFLDRVRTLLSLGPESTDLRDFLERKAEPHPPEGCEVDIELTAKDLLRSLLPERGKGELERVYRDLRAARGRRPTAGELYRMGYRPSTLRGAYGGWFDFVAAEKDLDEGEERVLRAAGDWLRSLEALPMKTSLEMVTLEALLEGESPFDGVLVAELARRSQVILARSPELGRDLEGIPALSEPRAADPRRFESYWRTKPIAAWTSEARRRWFVLDADRVVPRIPCPVGEEGVLVAMTRELVDYRLAMYRMRRRQEDTGASFLAKVIWNKNSPILKLPSRDATPELPLGPTDVLLPDGASWRFDFVKIACNVAHRHGVPKNELPDLLRGWFGPAAGTPGTAFYVRFTRSPDGLWAEPEQSEDRSIVPSDLLAAYPTLRAAAGAPADPVELSPEAEHVRLPTTARGEGLFAVRATGDSMDGGKRPIRDGDWLVMRFARAAAAAELEGRVALLQVPDKDVGFAYQVKRVVRDGGRWMLRSDNPARPSYEGTFEIVPIAILVDVVRPEDIGPRPGEELDEPAMAAAFRLNEPVHTGRIDGHLFLCVEAKGLLFAPDRLRIDLPEGRPGETAFVLTRCPGVTKWRFAGVARRAEEEGLWEFPAVDFGTYRALGKGRGTSRTLPRRALERARGIVDRLMSSPGAGATVTREGKQCRLVGRSADGGLRIDGGAGGFAERTVSRRDIGWALVASDDVVRVGGILDEQRLNRLRYIDGTPKESTRWIDSGWALFLVCAQSGGVPAR